jgi:uncharacterized membrane protein
VYLWLKALHVLGVVMFIGNITTGVFWHKHAQATRNPRILAHAMDGIIKSDRIFTMPGVLIILGSGIFAAIQGGFPILGTGWILWTLILFAVSGAVFMARLVPLQRRLHAHAQAGASSGSFDYDAYHRMAVQWDIWGAVATIAPLVGLALMVLKPGF